MWQPVNKRKWELQHVSQFPKDYNFISRFRDPLIINAGFHAHHVHAPATNPVRNGQSHAPPLYKKPHQRFNVKPINHNDYVNPLVPPMPDAPYPSFTVNDVIASSRMETTGRDIRNKRVAFFEKWLKFRRLDNLYAPTWDELKKNFDKKRFSGLVYHYIHWRFNHTKNLSSTLDEDIRAINYVCALNGIDMKMSDYGWRGQYMHGVDQICRHKFQRPPNQKKRALLNPIIEAMIKLPGVNGVEKLGILLAQRFVLRAQHYCKTKSKADTIKYGNIFFTYDDKGKVYSMTWRNSRDKNHPVGSHPMDRTIFCTCNTPWTCLPCYAKEFIDDRYYWFDKEDNEPLFQRYGSHEHVTDRDWRLRLKELIKQLGLDPKHYSLHSFRAGGASEMHIGGASPLDIQEFGHWEALDSVYEYIRIGNPDITRFVPSMVEYKQYRRRTDGTHESQLKARKKNIDLFLQRQLMSNRGRTR